VVTLARADAATFASPAALASDVRVSSDGVPCDATSARFVEAPPDGTSLLADYACPAGATPVEIDAAFVAALPFGHRHVAHAASESAAGAPADDVLTGDRHLLRVGDAGDMPGRRSHDLVLTGTERASSGRASLSRAASFARMGVEHILSGYDHLLFLLGLVLASRGGRSLVSVVSAFTAGHSISLACAVLGVWAAPPALIEPMIAASIVYVGIENLIARQVASRWRLTSLFGLVHGFGFAGALRSVHFERGSVPLVLGSFNLGVELGQLAVLAAVAPAALYLRRQPWFRRWGVTALNGAVAISGVAWTIARVLGGVS
jgi:hydrogenase/urease accessory protein HupE